MSVEQQVLDAIHHVIVMGEGYGEVKVVIIKGRIARISKTTVAQSPT